MADRLAYYLFQDDDETGFLWRVSKARTADDLDFSDLYELYEYDDEGNLLIVTRGWNDEFKRPLRRG